MTTTIFIKARTTYGKKVIAKLVLGKGRFDFINNITWNLFREYRLFNMMSKFTI